MPTPRSPRRAVLAVLTSALLVAPVAPALAASSGPATTGPAGRTAVEGAGERWRVVEQDVRRVRRAGLGTAPPASRGLRADRVPDSSDPVTAPFSVVYIGSWTATQKAAFQRAVDVWSRLLVSSVTIKVNASLTSLGPGFLGSAGPAGLAQDTEDGTWYPIALGNAIEGRDLNGSDPEIEAEFPSDNTQIYYGTGTPPAGTYDFTSTAMHELGHGLGFLGSMVSNGTSGFYGVDDFDNPLVYDLFTVHVPSGSPMRMLDYTNGSVALGSALESGQVFWNGAAGRDAAGGLRPQLYAPGSYEEGSSYSHLDENAYAAGTINSLMTPIGDQQEVNAEPGPIALGMLRDQGWVLSAVADPPVPTKYTAVDPVRVLDTRPGPENVGARAGVVGPGGVVDVTIAGSGVVPADATAVVLNVTGVAPTAGTDVRAYPTGATAAVPVVSNINLAAGRTRANLVTVKVGLNGRVRIRNNSGSLHLLADLAGYYTQTGAATYFPVSPTRLLDTRPGTAAGVPSPAKVPAGGTVDLQVTGRAGIPATATAVVLGVTAVNASQTTDVRLFPTPTGDTAPPLVSNLNVYAGGPTPNLVISKIGDGGRVRLRNNSGTVDLLADVYGYYEVSASGGLFRALSPTRVLDTRPGTVGAGRTTDVVMAGAGGIGAGVTAVALNITGTGPTTSTDVRAYPAPGSGSAVPTVSTLNLVRGQTAADAAIVPVGTGTKVRLYNNSGTVALIADVAGWFGP